jgi:hypothetical protein
MGINGKAKGSSQELKISHEFSARFNDHFQRTPGSGAFVGGFNRFKAATLRVDAQQILSGDLICPEFFPFSVESKNYSEKGGPKLYAILEGADRVLDGWIEQAKGDAAFAKKEYMIYWKITHKSTYITVDYQKFIDILKINNKELPEYFIKYRTEIILDKNTFLDNYVEYYLPIDKRANIKRTADIKDINNKTEVKVNDTEQPKTI